MLHNILLSFIYLKKLLHHLVVRDWLCTGEYLYQTVQLQILGTSGTFSVGCTFSRLVHVIMHDITVYDKLVLYIKQYTDQNILLMRTPETNKDVVYLMNTKLRTATMSG